MPDVLLKGDRFLDDLTVDEMAAALAIPVYPVAPSPQALAQALRRAPAGRRRRRCPQSQGEDLYINERRFNETER